MKSSLIDENASGVFVIAATPFSDAGALDLDSTDRMIDFYLSCKVAGMTILGMMGEASKLSAEESSLFLKRVLDRVAGRVPVIVGVSNPGVDLLVDFSREAMAAGAAGVMVAPISTLKTDEQIFGYYAAICERLGPSVPVVYQDFPTVTQVPVSVTTLERIIDSFPQVVMLKHEDTAGHAKLSRLRQGSDQGRHRKISILVGNGGLYLPQELARGADGAMTGFAYPEMLVEVCRRFAAKDATGGEDLFDIYLPLLRHEAQPGIGIAIRKELMRRRGILASAFVRLPGPKLTRDDHIELDWMVARLEAKLLETANSLSRVA